MGRSVFLFQLLRWVHQAWPYGPSLQYRLSWCIARSHPCGRVVVIHRRLDTRVALIAVWFLHVATKWIALFGLFAASQFLPTLGYDTGYLDAYIYVLAVVASMAFAGDRLLIVASSGLWDRSCTRVSSSYGCHSQFSLSGAEACGRFT